MLSVRTSLHCLLRVWFVGAAMTTQGMQHLGLLYALDPGLQTLHKDEQSLSQARKRYLGHINTHPFMAPILVGLLLSLEGLVATHKMPVQNMQRLIGTTIETFSAIGDSFFSGTLMVFWTLATTLLILHKLIAAAVIWSFVLLISLLIFRAWFYFLGLRHGLMVLTKLRSLNLINQAYYLKIANALLIAAIYWSICARNPEGFFWINFFGAIILLGFGAFLVNRLHIPRLILASLSIFALTLYLI